MRPIALIGRVFLLNACNRGFTYNIFLPPLESLGFAVEQAPGP